VGIAYLAVIISVFVALDFTLLFKASIKTAKGYFPKDTTVEDIKEESSIIDVAEDKVAEDVESSEVQEVEAEIIKPEEDEE